MLTSSGHRSLDALLLGGHPLGTSLLLSSDRFTSYAYTAATYWAAEAVAQGQTLVVVSFEERGGGGSDDEDDDDDDGGGGKTGSGQETDWEGRDFVKGLPKELFTAKAEKEKAEGGEPRASNPLPSSIPECRSDEEGGGDDDVDDDEQQPAPQPLAGDEQLTIAWQYRTDVQASRSGGVPAASKSGAAKSGGAARTYCHSYDLSKPMQVELLASNPPQLHSLNSDKYLSLPSSASGGLQLFLDVHALLAPLLSPPRSVVRLLLLDPPASLLPSFLPLLSSRARSLNLPLVTLATLKPWLSPSGALLVAAERAADVSLRFDGLSGLRQGSGAGRLAFAPAAANNGGGDSAGATGGLSAPLGAVLTTLRGALGGEKGGPVLGIFAPRRPAATTYGVTRDRRKMHIEIMHLPPADGGGPPEMQQQQGGGGGDYGGAANATTAAAGKGRKPPLALGMGCGASARGMGGGNNPLDF